MNYRGLKQAARSCLKDCPASPVRLTALFLLCIYGVTVASDAVTWLLEHRLEQASGFDAIGLRSGYAMWVVLSLFVVGVASNLWSAGYSAFALRLSRREPVGFATFLAGFRSFSRVLVLLLLMGLQVALWTMLMVIPGIVVFYRYRLALFALLDDPELSASQALEVSRRLTYGHKLELFLLDLRFFWYYLPAALILVLAEAQYRGLLPMLSGFRGELTIYGLNILLVGGMDLLALAYVQTTQAHAYNWMRNEDRVRRDAYCQARDGWAQES